MATKITDRNDWVSVWLEDKHSMIDTMIENISADLKAGYDPTGLSIMKQLIALAEYRQQYEDDCKIICELSGHGSDYAFKWCFKDLKRTGAIE